jgi:hypothetical protein
MLNVLLLVYSGDTTLCNEQHSASFPSMQNAAAGRTIIVNPISQPQPISVVVEIHSLIITPSIIIRKQSHIHSPKMRSSPGESEGGRESLFKTNQA